MSLFQAGFLPCFSFWWVLYWLRRISCGFCQPLMPSKALLSKTIFLPHRERANRLTNFLNLIRRVLKRSPHVSEAIHQTHARSLRLPCGKMLPFDVSLSSRAMDMKLPGLTGLVLRFLSRLHEKLKMGFGALCPEKCS